MSGADITIGLKIEDYRVKAALAQAPKIFAEEIDHWYNRERRAFLGTKSGSGSWGIKARLRRKPLFGHPEDGGWSPSVIGQFVSFKQNKGTLKPSMTMLFADRSPLKPAMEIAESGGTINSNEFMPIPYWKNLKQFGITKKFYQNFKSLAAAEELVPAHKGDTLFWFKKMGGRMLLLFTGKKHIKIHRQFRYRDEWEKRYPEVLIRGEKTIDRATRRMERTMASGILAE